MAGGRPPRLPSRRRPRISSDPADLLQRARVSIRHRVSPAIESKRRDLKENVAAYRKALEAALAAASEGLSSAEKERVENAISENFPGWATGREHITGNVPTAFKVISGAEDLHDTYLGKQSAINGAFDREMTSLSGIYILELQNQIEQLSREGKKRAVSALEAEISTVSREPERFRSIMGQ
jgi:hypothetical protein